LRSSTSTRAPGALTKIVDVAVHECAVVREAIDVESRRRYRRRIRVAAVDEQRDDVDHLRHVLRWPADEGRERRSRAIHLIDVGPFVLCRDLVLGPVLARGAFDDVVVDVGDVGNQRHLVAAPFEIAVQDVVAERAAGVAEMRMVVDRGPAPVDPCSSGVAWSEGDLLTGERVGEREHRARIENGCVRGGFIEVDAALRRRVAQRAGD
jgi:hypothetical protein